MAPWGVYPAATSLISSVLTEMESRLPAIGDFRAELRARTGIRLADIVDILVVPDTLEFCERAAIAGFVLRRQSPVRWLEHPRGLFPRILLSEPGEWRLDFRVESVDHFTMANRLQCEPAGVAGDQYRAVTVVAGEAIIRAVERHGYAGLQPLETPAAARAAAAHHRREFGGRRRDYAEPASGLARTLDLARTAAHDLGPAWACDLFLAAERDYWELRNRAGRIQKERQDALGLGWCNQDHHTYDSSREHFPATIAILECLGFVCRERFYAGAEAGWGSQILEHPVLGAVVFADIDLAPEELTEDFAHAPLRRLTPLRRAGLWCALHGESMLEAGLNHLECMFDAAALHEQLLDEGVAIMQPFTNFPHLYQELTEGEMWRVPETRLARLEREGLITREQAEGFRRHGAVGSHLENLERNDGYKGFNQPGISEVLRTIDPRRVLSDRPR